MIMLDTSGINDLVRTRLNEAVQSQLKGRPQCGLYLCAVCPVWARIHLCHRGLALTRGNGGEGQGDIEVEAASLSVYICQLGVCNGGFRQQATDA